MDYDIEKLRIREPDNGQQKLIKSQLIGFRLTAALFLMLVG
jgi:hypothetical protein